MATTRARTCHDCGAIVHVTARNLQSEKKCPRCGARFNASVGTTSDRMSPRELKKCDDEESPPDSTPTWRNSSEEALAFRAITEDIEPESGDDGESQRRRCRKCNRVFRLPKRTSKRKHCFVCIPDMRQLEEEKLSKNKSVGTVNSMERSGSVALVGIGGAELQKSSAKSTGTSKTAIAIMSFCCALTGVLLAVYVSNVFFAIAIIGLMPLIALLDWRAMAEESRRRQETEQRQRVHDRKSAKRRAKERRSQQLKLVCPHCHEKGHVRTRQIDEIPYSGGEILAGVLTRGLSVLARDVGGQTVAHCSNCGSTWQY